MLKLTNALWQVLLLCALLFSFFRVPSATANEFSVLVEGERKLVLVSSQITDLKAIVHAYFDPLFRGPKDYPLKSELTINGAQHTIFEAYYNLSGLRNEAASAVSAATVGEDDEELAGSFEWVEHREPLAYESFDDEVAVLAASVPAALPSAAALDPGLLEEFIRRQLRVTMEEAGYLLCLQEDCGGRPCQAVVRWHEIYEDKTGSYYFDELVCSDQTNDAKRHGAHALASHILGLRAGLYERLAKVPGAAYGKAEAAPVFTAELSEQLTRAVQALTSYSQSSDLGKKVEANVINSLYREFVARNASSNGALSPLAYLSMGLQTALATGLASGGEDGRPEFSELNLAAIPDLAERHLQVGEGLFSNEQQGVIEAWIERARQGLQAFRAARSKRLVAPSAGSVVSVKSILEHLRGAAEAESPSFALLERENNELLLDLKALTEFLKLPAEVGSIEKEEVDRRFGRDLLLGSAKFLRNLHTRAKIIARNSQLPTRRQTKKVMLAASGPGTGKTFGVSGMAHWAHVPICMLAAEKYNQMEIPAGKTAFTLIEEWIKGCLQDQFRIKDEVVIDGTIQVKQRAVANGILFFDDWHVALGPKGHLGRDAESREKFFALLKNLADPNQESPLVVQLSPERKFPLSLGRVEVVVTLNRIAGEFQPGKGDPPFISRLAYLGDPYPDEADRHRIAQWHLNPLEEAIVEKAGRAAFAQLNLGLCRERLHEIAEADIAIYLTKFERKLGIRGYMDVLNQYLTHIDRKLSGEGFSPDLCSFAGAPAFNLKGAIASLADYKKTLDNGMCEQEAIGEMLLQAEEVRSQLAPLPQFEQDDLMALLGKVSADGAYQHRVGLLKQAMARYQYVTNRVELPKREELARVLEAEFSSLRVDGANAKAGTDQFVPLLRVAENIHRRLKVARRERPGQNSNHLIRVTYKDSGAYDSTTFHKLGKAFGGLPVCVASQEMIEFPKDEWGVASDVPPPGRTNYLTVEEDPGESYYLHYRDIKGHRYYFLARDYFNGVILLLTAEAIKEFDKEWPTDYKKAHYQRFTTAARSTDEVTRHLTKILHDPQLRIWDQCCGRLKDVKGAQEGFIVLHINKTTIVEAERWAKLQELGGDQADPLALLESRLINDMNTAATFLNDGSVVDLRNNTVFLLYHHESGDKAAGRRVRNPMSIEVSFSAPPLEGRKSRGSYLLQTELDAIREDANEGGDSEISAADLKLTGPERVVFEALLEWDLELAERFWAAGYRLTIAPLEKSVKSLASLIKPRLKTYFRTVKKKATFPELEVFRREWEKIYRSYAEEAEQWIRTRREKEEALAKVKERQRKLRERWQRYAEADEVGSLFFGGGADLTSESVGSSSVAAKDNHASSAAEER